MGRVLAALAMGQLQQHSGFLSVGSAFFGFMRSQIESKRYFKPIGSMYGIYANIWGILMVNVTIYSTHGSYGKCCNLESSTLFNFPAIPSTSPAKESAMRWPFQTWHGLRCPLSTLWWNSFSRDLKNQDQSSSVENARNGQMILRVNKAFFCPFQSGVGLF